MRKRISTSLAKEILAKDYPDATCLLITSAWHMRRSKGCFDRVDLTYTPFSVDFLATGDLLTLLAKSRVTIIDTVYRYV